MKTLLIIYAAASLICFIRLALDKETTSFKKFLNYWYHPFIPIYNLVMTGFIFKELWKFSRVIFICCALLLLLLVLTFKLTKIWA